MLRKLIKNKKAQNTAEYAILISLVVAGIIAMQTYAQRALQARVRDASKYLAATLSAQNSTLAESEQYEPYYLDTNYLVNRDTRKDVRLTNALSRWGRDDTEVRSGHDTKVLNAALDGVSNGV